LNYARVTDFQRGADGKIAGIVVKDRLTGETFMVGAKVVVNATGPVSDAIRQLATPTVRRRMRPSKGAHILLPLDVFPTEDALLIPKTETGAFCLPCLGTVGCWWELPMTRSSRAPSWW
ncbi:MAG TPA: FAD-dependent oxidoreductase, partial [Candidatus Acidoferrum sp.]|nr:FAD-dependent oxidoreductase [Candidatus Acidoferrum sp.]